MAREPDPEDLANRTTGREVLVKREGDRTVFRITNKAPARQGIVAVVLMLLVAALCARISLSETHNPGRAAGDEFAAAALVIFACYGTWRTYKVVRWPARVIVDRTGLTAYGQNNAPPVHAAARSISSIQIHDRPPGRRQSARQATRRVPLVAINDGSEGFWLDGLAIFLPALPAAEQSQQEGVQEICALLKLQAPSRPLRRFEDPDHVSVHQDPGHPRTPPGAPGPTHRQQ